MYAHSNPTLLIAISDTRREHRHFKNAFTRENPTHSFLSFHNHGPIGASLRILAYIAPFRASIAASEINLTPLLPSPIVP